MGLTLGYSNPRFHSAVDATKQHTPEVSKLALLTQTALTTLATRSETITIAVGLTANGTARVYWAAPAACTITAIKASAAIVAASALGTITLAVAEGSGAATLLSTATIDAEGLTTTPTAKTLTATGASLILAAGETVNLALVSNNADATGGPVVVTLTVTWA